MKKKLQLLMSVVMVLAIMLTPIQANSGRINIQLKDLPGDWDEKAGVVFTLYQVGKMSDDGKSSSKKRQPIRMAVCLLRMSKMASIYLYPLIWKPMEVSILLS